MDKSNCCSIEKLIEGLTTLNIHLNDVQEEQFINYYNLLIERNKVMNLTAITDFEEVISKHYIDSLSIINVISLKDQKILDMGTGAGFPGVPLKIVFPETEILLMDSLNKRVNFLEEVIRSLNLNNITVLHGRAEECAKNPLYRENFDICVSRAVAKLPVLSEYCIPYVKRGGYFIAYKSGKIQEEIQQSEKAVKILGGKIEKAREFILPGTDIERTLVMVHKTGTTPEKYPRSAGKPLKEPLS